MIQDGTVVNIVDNAGGKIGKVFKILGSSKKRYAKIGDKVILSIKIAEPRKAVKKKDVCQAVIVRTVNAYRQKDGSYIRFDDNGKRIKKTKNYKAHDELNAKKVGDIVEIEETRPISKDKKFKIIG